MAHRKLTWFAKLGLVAKAVVYCTLGVLALQAAFGWQQAPGQQSVAQQLGAFGSIILGATAVGLILYAIWRATQALGITSGKKDADDRKETGKRLGAAGSALANGALGIIFGSTLFMGGGGGGGSWSGLLDSTWGRIAIGAAGICMAIAGIWQFVVAYRERYMKAIGTASLRARDGLRKMGKIAFSARGVVFILIGAGLVVSAIQAGQASYSSLHGALRQLGEQDYGTWLLALVAIGFIAYGILVAVMSRYIEAEDE